MMDWQAVNVPLPLENKARQRTYRTANRNLTNERSKASYRKEAAALAREEKWLAREFVAWDGEGVTREGRHDYVLLADSDGNRLRTVNGHLRTETVLNFVLTRARPGVINVIYGAGYDWNCWLADFTEAELQFFYDNQVIRWRGFLLKWRRGKTFSVSKEGQSVTFYDVVSFFQTSFVNACDAYLGDRFSDRAMIVENKMLRSSFRSADLDAIQKYNDAELVNLVLLMNELRLRLHGAGLKPSRWDGPGAVAVALLRREGVKESMTVHPPEVQEAARHAYFGGRFEVIQFGHSPERAYEYDINSAYPYGLSQVPNLAGGSWNRHGGYARADYALYRYSFRALDENRALVQPLPRRLKDGTVLYGTSVDGWAWTPEIETARAYVQMFGGTLDIHETLEFVPVNDVKPFGFIPSLYELRRVMKAQNNGAHVGVKLGLNSLYGKTCQQIGWSRDRAGNLRIPPYHQLDWAGFVTATCRAAVLRASFPVLDRIIAFETDAVFSEVPLDVPTGEALGAWEVTEFENITYLQSGMYYATKVSGKGREIARTRGVDKGTLSRAQVLDALRTGQTHIPAQLTRFTTAGIALQSRFDHWRKWERADKNVALYPNGKRVHVGCPQCAQGINGLHSTLVAPVPGSESLAYPVEWINPDEDMRALDEMRHLSYESDAYSD